MNSITVTHFKLVHKMQIILKNLIAMSSM